MPDPIACDPIACAIACVTPLLVIRVQSRTKSAVDIKSLTGFVWGFGVHGKEGVYHGGVELGAGAALEFSGSGVRGHCGAVRAMAGHGVVGIGYGNNAR